MLSQGPSHSALAQQVQQRIRRTIRQVFQIIRLRAQKKLTVEERAAAISTAVGDPNLRRHASELGERVRREHGVARAVAMIEELA